jgi:hypothetical protein
LLKSNEFHGVFASTRLRFAKTRLLYGLLLEKILGHTEEYFEYVDVKNFKDSLKELYDIEGF